MVGGSVRRARLLEQLVAAGSYVVIEAGPGYGKTTLVRQWEHEDTRTFVHTTPNAAALALHRGAIQRQRDGGGDPFVLVVDDVEEAPESAELLALVSEPLGPGTTVALVGREIGAGIATRLRLSGDLTAIGERDLAFSVSEAAAMLDRRLGALDLEEMVRTTHGWAVGLRLAQAAAAAASVPAVFTGADRGMRDYVRSDVLARLDAATRDLLTACAVIGPVSGPLCDAALGASGSAERLADLDRRHLFLHAADDEGRRYEWHPVVRDAIAADTVQRDPDRAQLLRLTAAEWHRAHDAPVDAIRLLVAAGDRVGARRLLAAVVLPLYESGRIDEIVELIHVLGHDEAQGDRRLADLLSLAGIMTGDERCATDWGRVAYALPPSGDPEEEAAFRVMRGHLAPEGIAGVLDDAAAGLSVLPANSRWVPPLLMMQGTAAAIAGRPDAAAILDEAIHVARERESLPALALSLAERALLAHADGRVVHARELIDQAMAVASIPELARYPQSALPFALRAADAAQRGRLDESRVALARAVGLGGVVGGSMPWLAVQLRLAIARTAVVLGDVAVIRRALDEATRFLALLPDAGLLSRQVDAMTDSAASLLERTPWSPRPLTSAELRLLPLLASHLSLEHVGARLHLSRNTVKTQTASIYRKLGVNSRTDAIHQALSLGLIAGPGSPPSPGPFPSARPDAMLGT